MKKILLFTIIFSNIAFAQNKSEIFYSENELLTGIYGIEINSTLDKTTLKQEQKIKNKDIDPSSVNIFGICLASKTLNKTENKFLKIKDMVMLSPTKRLVVYEAFKDEQKDSMDIESLLDNCKSIIK